MSEYIPSPSDWVAEQVDYLDGIKTFLAILTQPFE